MKLIEQLKSEGFRLGGSRRMAEKFPDQVKVGDGTDWDFYCADTPDNRAFLGANGFRLVEADDRTYWDDLLIDMYRHESLPVEVLVRSDVGLYSRAFESVSAGDFVRKLWKSSPLIDWRKTSPGGFKENVCAYFNTLFAETRTVAA